MTKLLLESLGIKAYQVKQRSDVVDILGSLSTVVG